MPLSILIDRLFLLLIFLAIFLHDDVTWELCHAHTTSIKFNYLQDGMRKLS